MQVEGNVVLIVDDDEMNLMVARMVLEKKLSCKVLTAGNGIDGIDILRRQHVSVVLLDIEMPFMDGFEALQKIRADAKIKHVPIIMLTASADKDTITKVVKQGVNGYIRKPFLPDDLVKRVKDCLKIDTVKKTVLIVDDSEIVCRAAKAIIDAVLPFGVVTVDSGIAALELFKTRPIDMILMSQSLPYMDGLSTAEMIARCDNSQNTGIVIMTDSEEEDYAVKAAMKELPIIIDFVRKPLTKNNLIPKLAKVAK